MIRTKIIESDPGCVCATVPRLLCAWAIIVVGVFASDVGWSTEPVAADSRPAVTEESVVADADWERDEPFWQATLSGSPEGALNDSLDGSTEELDGDSATRSESVEPAAKPDGAASSLFRDPRGDRATGGWFGLLGRTLLVLAGVCALAYTLLKWGVGRLVGGDGATGGTLEVVERCPLSPDRAVVLLRVGDRGLIVGDSEAGLAKLDELTTMEAVIAGISTPAWERFDTPRDTPAVGDETAPEISEFDD